LEEKNLTDPIADLQKNLLSVLMFRIRIRIDFGWLDPDPGGPKKITKFGKKFRNFMFCSAGCSLLRGEGFSAVDWTSFMDA
jgi:hypothetical protein